MEPESGNIAQMIDLLLRQIDRVRSTLNAPDTGPAAAFTAPKVSLETVEQLKGVVDGFRLFLWAYVEARSEHVDTTTRLRQVRMQSAADLLDKISSDFLSDGVPPTREAARLGEKIRVIGPLLSPHPGHRVDLKRPNP